MQWSINKDQRGKGREDREGAQIVLTPRFEFDDRRARAVVDKHVRVRKLAHPMLSLIRVC